jgi:hypothetical protein
VAKHGAAVRERHESGDVVAEPEYAILTDRRPCGLCLIPQKRPQMQAGVSLSDGGHCAMRRTGTASGTKPVTSTASLKLRRQRRGPSAASACRRRADRRHWPIGPGSLMQQSIWLTMSDAVVGEGAMK